MPKKVAIKNNQGEILVKQCRLADRFFSRLIGLLGQKGLSAGTGLILLPCDMVHTLGMRFPIDVVFVDRNGLVLATRAGLKPNRIAPRVAGAYAVIELPAGDADRLGIASGQMLLW